MDKKMNPVFMLSLVVVSVIVLWGLLMPAGFEAASNGAFSFLTNNFDWFYLATMTLFVVFSIWIAFSKYGKIRLGPDDSKPEYSTISWFSMLFSAGMGIGLVFWGVAEPLNHYMSPNGIEGATEAAKELAVGM